MTLFEEWVERTIPMTDKEKTFAWFAWKAAIKAEREACAKVCDEAPPPLEYFDVMRAAGNTARQCAKNIRMRSNMELRGATDD